MAEASYLPEASEYFIPSTEALQILIDLHINRTSCTAVNQSSLRVIDS